MRESLSDAIGFITVPLPLKGWPLSPSPVAPIRTKFG